MYWREDRSNIYPNTENSRKYPYFYSYYFDSYPHLNKTTILCRHNQKRVYNYREYTPIHKNTPKAEPA